MNNDTGSRLQEKVQVPSVMALWYKCSINLRGPARASHTLSRVSRKGIVLISVSFTKLKRKFNVAWLFGVPIFWGRKASVHYLFNMNGFFINTTSLGWKQNNLLAAVLIGSHQELGLLKGLKYHRSQFLGQASIRHLLFVSAFYPCPQLFFRR